MKFQQRKTIILRALSTQETIEIRDLAKELGVSEITVRRDLGSLADSGLIVRTHGGAMSLKASRDLVDFGSKAAIRQEEKDYIARLASKRVTNGDILFLDCGSTIFSMVPYLKGKQIKVITNSLALANALASSGVEINLIGGEVDQQRMAVHGAMAVQHISRYKATKAFIGVDGISVAGGLSAHSEKEAESALAMAKQSKEVYLLCDSSKLENDKYLRFAPLSLIDCLITDGKASEGMIQSYRKTGIEVLNR
jgi:DeoR family transcriptional regulator, fructose operon transcriptional repressor